MLWNFVQESVRGLEVSLDEWVVREGQKLRKGHLLKCTFGIVCEGQSAVFVLRSSSSSSWSSSSSSSSSSSWSSSSLSLLSLSLFFSPSLSFSSLSLSLFSLSFFSLSSLFLLSFFSLSSLFLLSFFFSFSSFWTCLSRGVWMFDSCGSCGAARKACDIGPEDPG